MSYKNALYQAIVVLTTPHAKSPPMSLNVARPKIIIRTYQLSVYVKFISFQNFNKFIYFSRHFIVLNDTRCFCQRNVIFNVGKSSLMILSIATERVKSYFARWKNEKRKAVELIVESIKIIRRYRIIVKPIVGLSFLFYIIVSFIINIEYIGELRVDTSDAIYRNMIPYYFNFNIKNFVKF